MQRKILLTLGCVSLAASTLLADVNANIELDPIIEEIVAGKRIMINANVEDEAGVDVVRTYFKSSDVANYSFVPMSCEKTECTSVLPAVSAGTKGIDYLILVKNSANVVYKTQTFSAATLEDNSKTPAYQNVSSDGTIQVKTELAKAPEMVEGFTDNIALDTVESTARYGIVAGLTTGSGTSAATAASTTGTTSAGTIAASSAGISTAAVVAGVAVVGGGAAAAGGGGSSSSDGDSHDEYNDTTDTQEEVNITEAQYTNLIGTWTTNYTNSTGDLWVYEHVLSGDKTCTYTSLQGSDEGSSGTCTWDLDNGYFTLIYSSGANYSGTATGSTTEFTADNAYYTGVWTR